MRRAHLPCRSMCEREKAGVVVVGGSQFEVADVSHYEGGYLLGSCEPSRRGSVCHLPSPSLFVFPFQCDNLHH